MLTGRVFISRTSDMAVFPEGRPFVRAVVDGVVRAGMTPVDMGYFAARDGQPAEYCRERVRQCEVYIAVVGFRYGSAVPGGAISYTELEFAESGAAGLPRLVFLLEENVVAPTDADRGLVDGFRARLRGAGLVTGRFATADGLELAVYQALTERVLAGGGGRAGPGVRFALPPDAAAFTGRGGELDGVTTAVRSAAGGGGVVAVRAIGGMPGVARPRWRFMPRTCCVRCSRTGSCSSTARAHPGPGSGDAGGCAGRAAGCDRGGFPFLTW